MNRAGAIRVEVSPGELVDRLTILRIKAERMTEPRQLDAVRAALATLERTRKRRIKCDPLVEALESELATVNGRLWDAEDAVRRCEFRGEFGQEFVAWARSIYQMNDRRSSLKRQIDMQLGAKSTEQKAHNGVWLAEASC